MVRVVFMGSPEFAVPILRAVAGAYTVAGVVTQPDRPAGRGLATKEPAVKAAARDLGIPILQAQSLKDRRALAQLRTWEPCLIVVAAFGQILRPDVLHLPEHGCINVHASLLPRWRGASPAQAAVAAGDAESGVTIMKMDEGMDTGPVLSQRSIPIGPNETGGSLARKLSTLGAALLIETLSRHLAAEIVPHPQNDSAATKAPLLKKEDGQLDLTQPALVLERRVRAFNPWPGAYIDWESGRLKIHAAHVGPSFGGVGKRLKFEGRPALRTADGLLILDEVQPAGKRSMGGPAFLAGARGWDQDEPQ